MSKHHGVIHRPGVIRRPLVQIAATNTHIFHLQQHIVIGDGWLLELADFDGAFFGGEVDDGSGFHGVGKVPEVLFPPTLRDHDKVCAMYDSSVAPMIGPNSVRESLRWRMVCAG
jgi:hypothetical protein